MKQMTGLDASFLYLETPNTYGHVNGLAIYQRPDPDFMPYPVVRERFLSMAGHLPPFRRRVVEVPFGLDHPFWVDDPDFDIDYHVREIGLHAPGTRDQLAEQVARIIGRKMDRSRPLWEVYVIDGLSDGRWALLTKFHHANLDGGAGVIMLGLMTETSPDEPWKFEMVEWEGEPLPSDQELVAKTLSSFAAKPAKAARLQLKVVRSLAEAAGIHGVADFAQRSREAIAAIAGRSPEAQATAEQIRKVTLPATPAPPTPWNAKIGPHRRFSMRGVSLNNLKALKDATGGTINDVVMAVCAGALRNYLIEHDALPEEPLRSMVPVSIRTGKEEDPWTNRVTNIMAVLPTDEADPVKRVDRCREAMVDAKAQLDLIPADTLTDLTEAVPPVVAGSAMRLQSLLADRVRLNANVVISNVPGPRQPIYFAGCQLDHYIPVSTIAPGMGLNITVHSYLDRIDFGLVADRDLVPDLEHMNDLMIAEVYALFEATGAEWAEAPDPTSASERPYVSPFSDETQALKYLEQYAAASRVADGSSAPESSAQKTAPKGEAKKSTAKKSPAKKSPANKSPAKKTAAKKSASKKGPAKKTGAKKSSTKK